MNYLVSDSTKNEELSDMSSSDDLIFDIFQDGFYLPAGISSDDAVIAFIFSDSTRTDPSISFADSWDNALGYYVFFRPSSDRDWGAFETEVRSEFSNILNGRIGWFDDSGESLGIIGVEGSGERQALKSTTTIRFRNINLDIKTLFTEVPVTRVDNTITISFVEDPMGKSISLTVFKKADPSQSMTILPIGNLSIPMVGDTQGVLAMGLSLSLSEMQGFEAGMLFYGAEPEPGAELEALDYPVFLPNSGLDGRLSFSTFLDPNQQTNSSRTYFEFSDEVVSSAYVTDLGQPVQLATLDSDINLDQETARLVFANRPVFNVDNERAWSLTPQGSFRLLVTAKNGVERENNQVLCAYTATESFSFKSGKNDGDFITFVSGKPSYREVNGSEKVFLSDKTTSSYVSLSTTENQISYYSQPQQSPLYTSDKLIEANPSTNNDETDSIKAFGLAFEPIVAWPPNGTSEAAGENSSPVPMVPYGAIDLTTLDADTLNQYESMESDNINPARRELIRASSKVLLNEAGIASRKSNSTEALTYRMTPLGLLGGFEGNDWDTTELAKDSKGEILKIEQMGPSLQEAFFQNQIFSVISQTRDNSNKLFSFTQDKVDLESWVFKLSPSGVVGPDGIPPIIIFKFYDGKSIEELVDDVSLWDSPDIFNQDQGEIQAYIQGLIEDAKEKVEADPTSIYANFYKTVTSTNFSGLLALNANMSLQDLPAPIRAVLGGMTKTENGNRVSNIDAFRVHHIGVEINDTDSKSEDLTLNQSAYFSLVDYQSSNQDQETLQVTNAADVVDYYYFKVNYLQALFLNSSLVDFSCKIELTINNLFEVNVNLGGGNANVNEEDNTIFITGTYENHSGSEAYSFIAENKFEYTFDSNEYLKKITLTKVQFSAKESEGGDSVNDATGTVTHLSSKFSMWGNMEFNNVDVLDVFSFDKLVFADLGITMDYDLTTFQDDAPPETTLPSLGFAPGNLRFDVSQSEQRKESDSLLNLIPFKLKSFLYSENGQAVQDLNYFPIAIDVNGFSANEKSIYKYALIFDLDLGSLGGLVSSLSAFKFSILIGWQPPNAENGLDNALILGVQLPEANGKLEINIEGVLKISIENFVLQYATDENGDPTDLFVLALQNAYMEVLGTRMPPNGFFNLAIFSPTAGDNKVGWIAAYNRGENGASSQSLIRVSDNPLSAARAACESQRVMMVEPKAEDSKVFTLSYLGIGQRVGPDPENPPTNFDEFLAFMEGDFWTAVKDGKYDEVYHPESDWIAVISFNLMEAIDFGFVFYDVTPFYSLKIDLKDVINFEITYTKVSEDVGLFYIDLGLPDSLRNFQVGAASVRLPQLALSIYTNGDFKVDVGFPANDDWSRSFRVEAQAGPVPVTGSGGFYISKLSSATDDTFTGDYPTILGFGFGARLGVGKDFTIGPLKAGVSLTFFGIIEGAGAYDIYSDSGKSNIIEWLVEPQALALKGQFGVIGELYGTVDFVLIKASVNLKIQASIGVQLITETSTSILLYVEASVTASASVSINLGLFKVKISFSFGIAVRFEWELAEGSNSIARLLSNSRFAITAENTVPQYQPSYPLQAGLNSELSTWMVREYTSIYTDEVPSSPGVPWLASSLTMAFINDYSGIDQPEQFEPFETLAAQMVTWALHTTIASVDDWTSEVLQSDLQTLSSNPDVLVGGLSYEILLQELGGDEGVFTLDIRPPEQVDEATTVYATVFPMLPFLTLSTNGREDGDFNFTFNTKSLVGQGWVDTTLQEYYEQLYVNITGGDNDTLLLAQENKIALIQSVFLDWFQALIRTGVNALLTQMQNDNQASATIKDVYIAAVKSGQIRAVAGQLSQFFRSGLRLPKTEGMELPSGSLNETNPLYGLVWQQLPVGTFDSSSDYSLRLNNADTGQSWVTTSDAALTISKDDVDTFAAVTLGELTLPSDVSTADLLNKGPRAYAFQNSVNWVEGEQETSIRPFSSAMEEILTSRANVNQDLVVSVMSRSTDQPYAEAGTFIPSDQITWATQVPLIVRKIPAKEQGQFEKNVYSLGTASLTVQNQLRELLSVLVNSNPVSSIKLLYQTTSGASGVVSDADPQALFVLRTNTSTQSIPPQSVSFALAEKEEPPRGAVGANSTDTYGFVEIIEQASVTNQDGYFLSYKDSSAQGLPEDLFGEQTFAPITILISYAVSITDTAGATVPMYANTALLSKPNNELLYYAQTTQEQDDTYYVAVASGSTGFSLSRGTPPEDGDATVQLDQLYGLVSFSVDKTEGFIESNLSVPVGPQAKDDDISFQDYHLSVPLYNLALDNQGQALKNRYASIGSNYKINAYINDAFGNQIPGIHEVVESTYLYFDDLVALSQWTGVKSVFDFRAWSDVNPAGSLCGAAATGGTAEAQKLTVYLCPNLAALSPSGEDDIQLISLYEQVRDQINAPGISFYVSTNLDPSGSDIALSDTQTQAVITFVDEIIAYIQGGKEPSSVALTVDVPSGYLPIVFEISASFGIRRDKNLIAPQLKDGDIILYPNAQDVNTSIPARQVNGDLQEFASQFSQAFESYILASGPADGSRVVVGAPDSAMLDAEGNEDNKESTKALWAVEKAVVTFDISAQGSVYYQGPTPLSTDLFSGTVPMPQLPSGFNLADEITFTDIDLDNYARLVFSAIDNFLDASNSSSTWQVVPSAYEATAYGRESIADSYAANEVQWLFQKEYRGSREDLRLGRDDFGQQMRTALSSAYAIDTVVQVPVTFSSELPESISDRLQLFGQVQRVGGGTDDAGGNFGLSTARVDIPAGSASRDATLTFLYGISDEKEEYFESVSLDLEWAATHLQVFLDADKGNDNIARPSLWLQLINGFDTPPHIGDPDTKTIIPLAFREYPTPPTTVSQSANPGLPEENDNIANAVNPLDQYGRWYYQFIYQAKLIAQDQLLLQTNYNNDLSNISENSRLFAGGSEQYTLAQALCRFVAAYEQLEPALIDVTTNTNADILTTFSELVVALAYNSDWQGGGLENAKSDLLTANTNEHDIVTDVETGSTDERLITLALNEKIVENNSWIAEKRIVALDPSTLVPYPGQHSAEGDNQVTNKYKPTQPIQDNWYTHRLQVLGLSVLQYENAKSGIQIERNADLLPDTQTNTDFVYRTPLVELTNPVTPFVQTNEAIDFVNVLDLQKNQDLGYYPLKLLEALLATSELPDDASGERRVKIDCRYAFPIASPSRTSTSTKAFLPLNPAILVRSFEIPNENQENLLTQWVGSSAEPNTYAGTLAAWAASRGLNFGEDTDPKGGLFVFDITLYAQLSNSKLPLLRLSQLQLSMSDVAVIK